VKITRFEDLLVWQEARKLTRKVYALTSEKKFSRDYSLTDQIRRACVSVTSNIAEGFDAQSNIEFIRFLNYSRRSVSEVKNQLYVALDEGYVGESEFSELYEMCSTVSKMICGFIRYLRSAKQSAR
jgi:four helix bundle protein